ncbi:hypothetical protein F5Y18DRAFT_12447 [Xylariaceae sp. FL1019]|nr:hypothetical protein F5Y18DRAFT_12447 [Xylariaceae sp. FL1019]
MQITTPILLSLATLAAAKTDLSGCTSSSTVAYGGASIIWYVPGTGEICAFLDCGGGMAPPKTTVPGCAAYSGTASYSPSYLPGFGSSTAAAASSTSSSSSSAAATESETSVMATSTFSAPFSASAASSGSSATITSAPSVTSAATTLLTGTAETSAPSSSSGASSSTGSSSSASSSGASSSNVSTGAAPLPTGMRGAWGVAAGVVAAGVALL